MEFDKKTIIIILICITVVCGAYFGYKYYIKMNQPQKLLENNTMSTDTVNNNAPQVYKDKSLNIHASNLCSEICLPSSQLLSFVCNLCSVNILHYEDYYQTFSDLLRPSKLY